MRGVSLRPSCVAQTKCDGVCSSDSWTLLATLLRCMQPRRKSWLNSKAKSFPQISAHRVCSQQIEMLLMFIIWPGSLFVYSRWGHLPILCLCVCVCVWGWGLGCPISLDSLLSQTKVAPWDPLPSLSMAILPSGPSQSPSCKWPELSRTDQELKESDGLKKKKIIIECLCLTFLAQYGWEIKE